MNTFHGYIQEITDGGYRFSGTLNSAGSESARITEMTSSEKFSTKEEAEIAMKDYCSENGWELIQK